MRKFSLNVNIPDLDDARRALQKAGTKLRREPVEIRRMRRFHDQMLRKGVSVDDPMLVQVRKHLKVLGNE